MSGDAVARIEQAARADDMRGLRDALSEVVGVLANSASRYVSDALAFIHHREQLDWLQVGALEERLIIVLRHLETIVSVLEQLACATKLLEHRAERRTARL